MTLLSRAPLWRQIQKNNFTRLELLLEFLELSEALRASIWVNPRFPLNVPLRLAEKMRKNTLDCPIVRQFLPLEMEAVVNDGFMIDPVQDRSFCKTGKYLQKYRGRALLLTTSACAMHCRFCFRQNFPYETEVIGFEKELKLLASDDSIEEIILSGGDPLSLSHQALEHLFRAIEKIPHVKRLRFHTRFPIGIPERIDEEFLVLLKNFTKQIFFVIHCNHAKELDADVVFALKKIARLGIPVLNQAVLLKGVNDCEEVLLSLSEALINAGIVPYYLHQLDLVQGSAHFFVSQERAIALVRFLQENISGFGVPRLVREEPGRLSKSSILS